MPSLQLLKGSDSKLVEIEIKIRIGGLADRDRFGD
jgi:hypothetical protein